LILLTAELLRDYAVNVLDQNLRAVDGGGYFIAPARTGAVVSASR